MRRLWILRSSIGSDVLLIRTKFLFPLIYRNWCAMDEVSLFGSACARLLICIDVIIMTSIQINNVHSGRIVAMGSVCQAQIQFYKWKCSAFLAVCGVLDVKIAAHIAKHTVELSQTVQGRGALS